MEAWPNFFIVGVPKAGTTTLYEYLKKIPGIYMSPIKEPFYFSKKTIPDIEPFKPIRDKKKYLDLFKQATSEKIIGEASTLYLSDPDALNLIHEVSPEARILISLRDPIERIYSHYFMIENYEWIESSFHNQIQKELMGKFDITKPHLRLNAGLYYEDIKKCLDLFGEKNVKIIIFEEFIKNPKDTIESILKFLKIQYPLENFHKEKHGIYYKLRPKNSFSKYMLQNKIIKIISRLILPPSSRRLLKTKVFLQIETKKPEMEKNDKDVLKKYYYEDVNKLQILLDRELPWSNFLD